MKLSLARDVTLTPIDTGAVLLDGSRGRYWQLNESGSKILSKLLEGESPAMTAVSLSAAAPVTEVQAQQDVMALIDALSAAKLVEVSQ
ncbi:lasso peptide biosynthesis PqqD family chaperone [Streptomyces katsurahamanus]|uniref:Lasso peptide biosynthesis PqqD family chaperone n=1 Tax=Streptomyces katsurahamanus TaxID=2577098 RepID=A0ABW9NW06_9ACTN|nr:lasso peptide biosynthesis PqqD family chaperone [Streptomyces katsurahamanus]MQS37331.1 lasso peptide biosynthesis PqqD family chaperone [Streptomyces katsurahamanus]